MLSVPQTQAAGRGGKGTLLARARLSVTLFSLPPVAQQTNTCARLGGCQVAVAHLQPLLPGLSGCLHPALHIHAGGRLGGGRIWHMLILLLLLLLLRGWVMESEVPEPPA